MAENLVATEPCEAEGAADDVCDTLDFQSFEDEIRELLCPKETKQVALLRQISGDIEQIQADEILALKAIFEDDLRMVDESTAKYFKIKINPIAEQCHDDEVVDLWFCLPSQYPVIPPIFEIEGHGSLSSAKADKLYSLLMKEACSRLNSLMIYDLITIAQDFVQETMAEVRERRKKEEVTFDEEPKLEECTSDNAIEEHLDTNHYTNYGGIDLRDTQKYIGHIHVLEKVPSHLKIQS
ncbi:kinase-like domain-containing, partial [Paramuricea clavata]